MVYYKTVLDIRWLVIRLFWIYDGLLYDSFGYKMVSYKTVLDI